MLPNFADSVSTVPRFQTDSLACMLTGDWWACIALCPDSKHVLCVCVGGGGGEGEYRRSCELANDPLQTTSDCVCVFFCWWYVIVLQVIVHWYVCSMMCM